jgi:hypothetical protein
MFLNFTILLLEKMVGKNRALLEKKRGMEETKMKDEKIKPIQIGKNKQDKEPYYPYDGIYKGMGLGSTSFAFKGYLGVLPDQVELLDEKNLKAITMIRSFPLPADQLIDASEYMDWSYNEPLKNMVKGIFHKLRDGAMELGADYDADFFEIQTNVKEIGDFQSQHGYRPCNRDQYPTLKEVLDDEGVLNSKLYVFGPIKSSKNTHQWDDGYNTKPLTPESIYNRVNIGPDEHVDAESLTGKVKFFKAKENFSDELGGHYDSLESYRKSFDD